MTRPQKFRSFETLERRNLLALADDVAPGPMGPAELRLQPPADYISAKLPLSPIFIFPPQPERGNITADVVDGVLKIRGDEQENGIGIWSWEPAMGSYFLAAKSINGQPAEGSYNDPPGGLIIEGAFAGLDIDLGDGGDYVSLNGHFTNVIIRTGAGNDGVSLGGSSDFPYKNYMTMSIKTPQSAYFSGDLLIDTGEGNDELDAFAFVTGNVHVQMGAGEDTFREPTYNVGIIDYVIFAQLRAEGTRVVDLGPDEVAEDVVPADWHSDPTLAAKLDQDLKDAFATIDEAKANSTYQNGRDVTWYPADGGQAYTTNRDGRLAIEFRFDLGNEDLYFIDATNLTNQLRQRGLRIESLSFAHSIGYAVIHEAELALFANLPGITGIGLQGATPLDLTGGQGWSYFRPPNVSLLDPPDANTLPIGPRVRDDRPQTNQGADNLLYSYYGPPRLYGPLKL